MTQTLWLMVVGSTLAWAAFDGVRKRLVLHISVVALSFWISVAQLPGYLVWATLEGRFSIADGYFGPALLSFGLNLLANLLFLESVRRGPLSVAIPVLSFTPVFAALGSIPLLGEHLGHLQWFGICVVTAASVFLTAERDQARDPLTLVRGFFASPGVPHMFGVAVLWSFSPIFDKLALRHTTVGVHGLFLALAIALGTAAYLGLRSELRSLALPRGTLALLAVGGATNVAALGLQLVSITQMTVSVFEAFKRAAGVLIALGMGALIFRETVSPTRATAAVFMAVGVTFVLRG